MSKGISPNELGWVDGLIYGAGIVAICVTSLGFFAELFAQLKCLHRRYNIGKEIEEAEEAKGVS